MKIFVVGASGFIGQHLVPKLSAAGHEVVCDIHGASGKPNRIAVDFTRDHAIRDWLPRLTGFDVIVNLVGIVRERGAQTFLALHELAPRALFAACVEAGVGQVVHFSALGADEQARSRYHLSKRRADEFLRTLPLEWTIVQPSLVFGSGGASARLFTSLAVMPAVPMIGRGDQLVQPIHVEDLCEAVVHIIRSRAFSRRSIPAVGPRPVTFRAMISALRRQLGLPRARFVHVPLALVKRAARFAQRLSFWQFDEEAIGMLERGNTGPPNAIEAVLVRSPRPVEKFIAPQEAQSLAVAAKANWLLPLLRASIGIVWIVTGILSLGVYPVEESHALLARVGVGPTFAPFMLYGAAALDLLFGVGVFVLRRRRWLWRAQIVLIVLYSAIIAFKLPEFWMHPFGPLLKNIPLLATIIAVHELETR